MDGNSQEHGHTISRHAFCIDSSTVSWNSHKQALISLSTTKSEYIAMTHAAKEAIWIRMFLRDILCPLSQPMLLYCNNQSAIAITKNDQYHARTKHIDIQHHFIWELIRLEIIEVQYCPTKNMIADILQRHCPSKTSSTFAHCLECIWIEGEC